MKIHNAKIADSLRLKYRRLKKKDIPDMFDIWSDEQVVTYLSFEKHQDIQETKEVFKRVLRFNTIGLIDRENNKCIGSFGLIIEKDKLNAECGYVLNRLYWHQGYMSEAFTTIIDWLKENTKVSHLRAKVCSDNMKSCLFLERQGFIKESEKREYMVNRGIYWLIITYRLDI